MTADDNTTLGFTTITLSGLQSGSSVGLFDQSNALVESGTAGSSTYTFATILQSNNNYTVEVRRYGYQPLVATVALVVGTVAVPISQAVNPFVVLSSSSAAALSGISINYGSSLITVSANRTLSELYDFVQSSFALVGNIAQSTIPASTSDGLTRSLNFNLTLTSTNTLSGSGTLAVGNRTLTVSTAQTYSFVATLNSGVLKVPAGAAKFPSFSFASSTIDNTSASAANPVIAHGQSPSTTTTGGGAITLKNETVITSSWSGVSQAYASIQVSGSEVVNSGLTTSPYAYTYNYNNAANPTILVKILKQGYSRFSTSFTGNTAAQSISATLTMVEMNPLKQANAPSISQQINQMKLKNLDAGWELLTRLGILLPALTSRFMTVENLRKIADKKILCIMQNQVVYRRCYAPPRVAILV
jgi:hypothetical protein